MYRRSNKIKHPLKRKGLDMNKKDARNSLHKVCDYFKKESGVDKDPQKLNLLKLVRMKCIDCCCFSPSEVEKCHLETCPLWIFRFGKNPLNRRDLTDEERKVLADRLNKHRKQS